MALNGPAALAAVTVLEGSRIVDGAELASRVRAVRAAVAGHARVALLPPASADGVAAILGLLGAPVAAGSQPGFIFAALLLRCRPRSDVVPICGQFPGQLRTWDFRLGRA